MSIDGINSKRADVSKLQQAGIHKSNFKDDDQKMKSLFDAMDTDGDGVINEEELKNFTGIDKNNDGTIKRSEARKFLKEHKNLKELGIKKRDVIEFLNKAGIVADGIEDFSGDKENGYTVDYKSSDTKKTIDKNGNYSNYDESGNFKTYDVNGQLLSSTVIDKETNTTATTTFVDGDETKIDKEIIKKNDGTETITIKYQNNHPASKEVVRGTTVETYEYIDGKEVKTSVIENKGIPAKETRTEFRYNDDGSYTAFMTQAGTNTTAAINYNSEGKRLDETKVVDGREYKAEYDGKGNTKGVVLQKGETIEQLADKFGCSVKDLQQLNGKEKFSAGDEITVKGEIEADDEKLTSRKSADEVKSEVKSEEDAKKAEQQRQAELAARKRAIARAKRAAEDAQLKPLGLKDRKGAGEKITGEFKGGSKKTFTKVGNAINQRTIVKDEKGKYYVISHDGKVLKEEYVQKTTLYATGKKVDCKAKDANGKLITVQYAEIPGYKDKHGRTLVVDKNGNYHLRSHDGMLLKADYIDRSNKADEIKADSAKARETALEMLDSQLAAAQKDFDAQMKADGWAGDVADGISILWGSKNRASVVRKEFAHLRSDIAECKLAAMNEGDEGFRAKFKEKFGVPFNQQALADYVLNPTPANYRKAFGSKQPIGERVAQYNQSQQQGAQWVKTGVKVGAAVGAGILTGGIGGAAVATALVSGIVEETDHMNMSGNWTDSQGQTHVEDRFSFREGTNHAEIWRDAALDGGAVLAGGMAGKVAQAAIKGTTTAASVARAGIMTSADVVYGAGQEYIQTGDVTTEGVLMNAALSGVGNAIGSGAFKKSSTAPEVKPQGAETPTLSKAVKHQASPDAPAGIAHNSDVHIKTGKKAQEIGGEIDDVIKNSTSGEELAKKFNELGGISNGGIRKTNRAKIKEAINKLSPEEQEKFKQAVRKHQQSEVNHIFERNNELKEADIRTINEYLTNTTNPSELETLKQKLQSKELSHGGVTSDYKDLYKKIDAKITQLKPMPTKGHAEITAKLEDKIKQSKAGEKGAGMSVDDVKELSAHIKNVQNAEELEQLNKLIENKNLKMSQGQRNQLKSEITKQQAQVQNKGTKKATEPKSEPKAEEPSAFPTEEPKVEIPSKESPKEPQVKITEEDYKKFAQIDKELTNAKTQADLLKAEQAIKEMPECATKRNLMNKIANKKQYLPNEVSKANPLKEEPKAQAPKQDLDTKNITMKKGDEIVIDSGETLLIGGEVIDMKNMPPAMRNKLANIPDGQPVKIGRNEINPNNNLISREHLTIIKENGKFRIIDNSANGTTILNKEAVQAYKNLKTQMPSMNSAEFRSVEQAFLENTGYNYELLNNFIRKSGMNVNSPAMRNVLKTANSNNKIILEQIASGKGISKSGAFGSKTVNDSELANLMMFNRNNKNVASLISDPKSVSTFLKNAEEQIGNLRKVHSSAKVIEDGRVRTASNTEIADAIVYGETDFHGVKVKVEPNTNVLDDMECLIHGKDYIKHFNQGISRADVMKMTQTGDVFSVNGKMYVNDGNNLVRLNLSEDSFRQLFPPVQRFTVHQGEIGCCYLDTSINMLANSKSGRAQLYQMIGEEPKGHFYTTMANSEGRRVPFERFTRHAKHMLDQNGLAIIEQGYCYTSGRLSLEPFRVIGGGKPGQTQIMIANKGGNGRDALSGLTGSPVGSIENKATMRKYIMEHAGNDHAFIYGSSKNVDGAGDGKWLNRKYDIAQTHAYSVMGYDKATDCVLIANPWHSGVSIKVPMDEFLDKFRRLDIGDM